MLKAVIFDVDGVLLHLTRSEEELFFEALSKFVPTQDLSRDWNSYRIRNDDDIIAEILGRNGLPLSLSVHVKEHYVSVFSEAMRTSRSETLAITDARQLLEKLAPIYRLGIATANLRAVAKLRLEQAGLWQHVSAHAQGADGGGHKSEILRRLLDTLPVDKSDVVYIGDNINDVEAGLSNGVHFIGFSEAHERRDALRQAGAHYISANHVETMQLITTLLA